MNRRHDWLRQAQIDLDAADALLAAGKHGWTCFAAQQCVEKALKALVLDAGKSIATHNVVELLQALAPHLALPPDVVKASNTVNRYYIPTRYPGAFSSGAPGDQFFEPEAREAVDLARMVYQFAANHLRPSGPPAP